MYFHHQSLKAVQLLYKHHYIGVVENFNSNESEYATVYPCVEILRGRLGAPTDEEMILSQDLFETLYHNKIIPLQV